MAYHNYPEFGGVSTGKMAYPSLATTGGTSPIVPSYIPCITVCKKAPCPPCGQANIGTGAGPGEGASVGIPAGSEQSGDPFGGLGSGDPYGGIEYSNLGGGGGEDPGSNEAYIAPPDPFIDPFSTRDPGGHYVQSPDPIYIPPDPGESYIPAAASPDPAPEITGIGAGIEAPFVAPAQTQPASPAAGVATPPESGNATAPAAVPSPISPPIPQTAQRPWLRTRKKYQGVSFNKTELNWYANPGVGVYKRGPINIG